MRTAVFVQHVRGMARMLPENARRCRAGGGAEASGAAERLLMADMTGWRESIASHAACHPARRRAILAAWMTRCAPRCPRCWKRSSPPTG